MEDREDDQGEYLAYQLEIEHKRYIEEGGTCSEKQSERKQSYDWQ